MVSAEPFFFLKLKKTARRASRLVQTDTIIGRERLTACAVVILCLFASPAPAPSSTPFAAAAIPMPAAAPAPSADLRFIVVLVVVVPPESVGGRKCLLNGVVDGRSA